MAKFKWTVEFSVDPRWVADGFDLTDERAHAMLANDLTSAYGGELKARVVRAPTAASVAKEQGGTAANIRKERQDGRMR